jgi:hypothetical protein
MRVLAGWSDYAGREVVPPTSSDPRPHQEQ